MSKEKKFFLLTLGVLALTAVVGGTWVLLGQRLGAIRPAGPTSRPSPGGSPRAGDDVARCDRLSDTAQQAACRSTGFYLWLQQQQAVALKTGSLDACDRLPDDESRDHCRLRYFGDGEKSDCAKLEVARNREGCELLEVSRRDDFGACSQFSAASDRSYCQQEIVGARLAEGPALCDRYGSSQQLTCLEVYWTMLASVESNYQRCAKIRVAQGVERCLATLPPDTDRDGLADYLEERTYDTDVNESDTDGDGLSDYDEVKVYGTLPRNPDTDGDGHTDGTEVHNGFNPKGEGKLKP